MWKVSCVLPLIMGLGVIAPFC